MSEEQLKALLKKVKGDTSLQEKFKAAASPDAAVEIAKDAGFAITAITTFFFAITIIGPHTPVQANYYQGCNEECQEARRRSHCDAEGRCIRSIEPDGDGVPDIESMLPADIDMSPAGSTCTPGTSVLCDF